MNVLQRLAQPFGIGSGSAITDRYLFALVDVTTDGGQTCGRPRQGHFVSRCPLQLFRNREIAFSDFVAEICANRQYRGARHTVQKRGIERLRNDLIIADQHEI